MDLLAGSAGARTVPELAATVVRGLHDVVSADMIAWNEVVPGLPMQLVTSPPTADPNVGQQLGTWAHEHPLVRHYERTRDPAATRVSDHVDLATFRATNLHREVFARRGIDHVMAMTVRDEPDRFVAIAVMRASPDFDTDEVGHFDALRGPLAAILARVADAVPASTLPLLRGHGLVIVDVDAGRVRDGMDRTARGILAAFGPSAGDDRVPDVVRDWLVDAGLGERLLPPGGAIAPGPSLTVVQRTGNERVRLLVGDTRHVPPIGVLRETTGMTHREADVMVLVIRGWSNRAIADELSLAETTVKKHLERIYRRLEVTSRTAAVAHVLELGA